MRNYFPKRPSGAPLHTLSRLYDVPVGYVPPPLFWGWILLILRSPKGGCCSISDDLSCSLLHERRHKTNHLNLFSKNAKVETFAKLLEIGVRTNVILPLLKDYFSIHCYLKCILQYCCFFLKKNYGGGQKFSIKRKQNSNIRNWPISSYSILHGLSGSCITIMNIQSCHS